VWQKIVEIAKQVFSLTSDTKKLKEDIKALQEENKELRRELNEQRLKFEAVARFSDRMVYELQRTKESAEADKRLLRVEMENLLLRSGRVLPPAENESADESGLQ
jgi:chromosome segregation ATPase